LETTAQKQSQILEVTQHKKGNSEIISLWRYKHKQKDYEE